MVIPGGIMEEEIIRVENLKKHFKTGKKLLHAVDGVSLSIQKGQIFGVVGESGSGKSTLGQCVLRLLSIDEGQVYFQGKEITHLHQRELKQMRRSMSMVFQNPFSSFNPKMTIGNALREVGMVHKMEKSSIDDRMDQLLGYISLGTDILARHPNELSGGQLQRLGIARALMLEPVFVMADEPTSALDVSIQAQILNLLVKLKENLGLTMMLISHELTVVEHVCDVVAVMYLGRIVELAPAVALFGDIGHPYTSALMAAKPIDHPADRGLRQLLQGDMPSAFDIPKGCRFHPRCPEYVKDLCDRDEPELRELSPSHYVACHRRNPE